MDINQGTDNTEAKTRSPSDYLLTPNARWQLSERSTEDVQVRSTALTELKFPLANYNLKQRNWFHSLPFQRFQALLTLFPKSFSSFPHGTCLLSVSGQYLALDENYRPFSAPIPKYATLNSHTG